MEYAIGGIWLSDGTYLPPLPALPPLPVLKPLSAYTIPSIAPVFVDSLDMQRQKQAEQWEKAAAIREQQRRAEVAAKQRAEQWEKAEVRREKQRRAEEQKKAQTKAIRDGLFSHLGELISRLYTDEGRAHVVSGLVDKNRQVPKEYLDKTLVHYEKKEDIQSLAHLAQKAGVLENLLNRYDSAGKYETGAAVADAAGLAYRATQFRNKIPTDKKTVMFDWIQAHQEGAAPDETIAALLEVGRIADAADVAHHAGLLQDEIMLRESAGQFAEAAQLQEQLLWPEKQQNSVIRKKSKERELAEKIVENYLKDRWIEEAAHVAKKVGDKEWEIRIYENAQYYDHALRVAGNKRERKLLTYERAGRFVDARNFSKQSGLKRDARMYNDIATLLETVEPAGNTYAGQTAENTKCQEKPSRGILGAIIDTLLYFPRRIAVDLISDDIKQHLSNYITVKNARLALGTLTIGTAGFKS